MKRLLATSRTCDLWIIRPMLSSMKNEGVEVLGCTLSKTSAMLHVLVQDELMLNLYLKLVRHDHSATQSRP